MDHLTVWYIQDIKYATLRVMKTLLQILKLQPRSVEVGGFINEGHGAVLDETGRRTHFLKNKLEKKKILWYRFEFIRRSASVGNIIREKRSCWHFTPNQFKIIENRHTLFPRSRKMAYAFPFPMPTHSADFDQNPAGTGTEPTGTYLTLSVHIIYDI